MDIFKAGSYVITTDNINGVYLKVSGSFFINRNISDNITWSWQDAIADVDVLSQHFITVVRLFIRKLLFIICNYRKMCLLTGLKTLA